MRWHHARRVGTCGEKEKQRDVIYERRLCCVDEQFVLCERIESIKLLIHKAVNELGAAGSK